MPSRPARRSVVVIGTLLALLLLPAAILGLTVTWTNRSADTEHLADQTALQALQAHGKTVATGGNEHEAEVAATAAAHAYARHHGVSDPSHAIALTFTPEADGAVRLHVVVHRGGLGAGLAEMITGDDPTTGEANASLQYCTDQPVLKA